MRNLTDLVKKHGRVWLFISNENRTKDFIKRATDEGFRYHNGSKISDRDNGVLWGLHEDLTVTHLSMMCWCLSYKCDPEKIPVRIDYRKYIDGEEDYICHKSPIKAVSYELK